MKKFFYSTLFLLLSVAGFSQGIYQIWGMTTPGGADDIGAIFRTDGEGKNIQSVYSFPITNLGASPMYNQLTEFNGKFYSMTSQGGSNNLGVIFEWDPVSNIYIKKYDFELAGGINPHGSLVVVNGKLYGMTLFGGANDKGVIFEWDPASNIYTKKYDFDGANGNNPYGSLIFEKDKFYGMTRSGGVNDKGVIFDWDPVSNVYTKKYDFDGVNGSNPYGDLAIKGGKFYGMTSLGGSNNLGVIFEWNPNSNNYSKKYDFDLVSQGKAYGSLVLANGKFYGLTYGRAPGSSEGIIFEWDPAGNTFTNKHDFGGGEGNPRGNLLFHEGKLYGLANSEYRTKGMYWAYLFAFDLATNTYSNIYNYHIGPSSDNTYNGAGLLGSLALNNGKIYGMTASGGGSNNGVIFEWNSATSVFTKKINLNAHENGASPNSLVFHNNLLYGITNRGGFDGLGSIFEWDFTQKKLVKKYDFDGVSELNATESSSRYPTGKLTLSNGKFYGMSYYMLPGGPHPKNHIFEWNAISNEFTEKLFFGNGYYGNGGNFTENEGNLYGMINRTGSMIFFKYAPSANLTSNFSESYTYTDGFGLAERKGKLYGVSNGGVNNAGIIVELDITANTSTTKYDFIAATGSTPIGTMVLYNDRFYGMTAAGGANNTGVIFEWDPASNIYTKKYDFNVTDGGNPISSLVLNNGKLYGMTRNGGSFNLGTIFEWNPVTNVYTKKSEFNGANGRNPTSKNALTLVPAEVAGGLPGSCESYSPVIIDNANSNEWVAIMDDDGLAVAEIKANGNNLGIVNASVYINNNAVREDDAGRLYLDRNITITPQFQPSSSVDIRLYIRGEEFSALKNADNSNGRSSGVTTISDLGVFKNDDGCNAAASKKASSEITTGAAWIDDYVLQTSVTKFSTFYFADKTIGALPLTLLEFSGKLENNNALLNWKTENELNTVEFIVERSIDGIQYKAVGTVAAANRPGIHNYNFTDPSVATSGAKIIYYRLQQKDLDGHFTYSKIVTLSLDNENTLVRLYPNPVSNELNLVINSTQRDNIKWQIIDVSGRIINNQIRQVTRGRNNFAIDVTRMAKGVYFLSIQGNEINKWLQFVKQ